MSARSDLDAAAASAYTLAFIGIAVVVVFMLFGKQIWKGLLGLEETIFTGVDATLTGAQSSQSVISSGLATSAKNVLDPIMGWIAGSTYNLSIGKGPLPMFGASNGAASVSPGTTGAGTSTALSSLTGAQLLAGVNLP